ncbi:MAG: PQQ-binding-like beta-propeller repeat protein [Dehalococcoidia bacterium]|nr:PQQ-binding-like beta-propeller repeat protein [Dehalococcoidia bacterium]
MYARRPWLQEPGRHSNDGGRRQNSYRLTPMLRQIERLRNRGLWAVLSGLAMMMLVTVFLVAYESESQEPKLPGEYSLQPGASQESTLLWEYPLRPVENPHNTYAVVIDNDVAFISISGKAELHALDARTGQVLWRKHCQASVVVDGVVYCVHIEWLGRVGGHPYPKFSTEIIAVDARSGEEFWSYQPTEGWMFGGMFISDGVLVIRPSDSAGYTYTALDADTGRLVWDAHIERATGNVADGAFYAGARDEIAAIETATGRDRWRREVPEYSSIAGAGGGVVLIDIVAGGFEALSAETGRREWRYMRPGRSVFLAGVTGEIAVFQSRPANTGFYPEVYPIDRFCAVNALNGQHLWCREDLEGENSVWVRGDALRWYSDDRVALLDAQTGRELWSHDWVEDAERIVDASKSGDDLYVNVDGMVSALEPNSLNPRWEYQLVWDNDPSDRDDNPYIRAAENDVVILWTGAGLVAVGLPPPGGVFVPSTPTPKEVCSNGIVVPVPEDKPGLVADCAILLAVRGDLTGDSVTLAGEARLNWNADVPITEWENVWVADPADWPSIDPSYWPPRGDRLPDSETGPLGSATRVVMLTLWSSNLAGKVPPGLGDLSELRELMIGSSSFTGGVPPELGRLENLEGLFLGSLTGPIPPELGNLASLRIMDLGDSWFSGEIPPELGNLSNLEMLYLEGNQLTGPIPPELGNLSKLSELRLFENQLSGEIPPELSNLSSLGGLHLQDNRLTGQIPAQLGSLSRLGSLQASRNQLTGEIPSELGNISYLWRLELQDNRLVGQIPPELGNLEHLEQLELSGNRFGGCLPVELLSVADGDIYSLDLPLCTGFERDVLVALYHATGGPDWIENTNWLGDVPLAEWHGVTTDANGRVTMLDLAENGLNGTLPGELGELQKLNSLILPHNRLSGAIPLGLGQLEYLDRVELSQNVWNGCIADDLLDVPRGDLRSIELPRCADVDKAVLTAFYHATGGPNWTSSTNWTTDAPLNDWEGVSAHAGGYVTTLSLPNNRLSGELPPELGNLTNLEALYLNGNQLIGEIPPELSNLTSLRWIRLNQNQLSGEIPPELGNLTNLEQLNLSNNRLGGEVPPELWDLSFLDWLHLNGNLLHGCIPTEVYSVYPRINSATGLRVCIRQEREALVALYHATDGPNWTERTNWLSEAPLSKWHGVTTDANGRVTMLNLADNGLNGTLPGELRGLSELQSLILSSNRLGGEIPPDLGSLSSLGVLDLNGNQLDGEIPPELLGLSALRLLNLANNRLAAEIPPGLSGLSNLTGLFLSGNQLSGCIPLESRYQLDGDLPRITLPLCIDVSRANRAALIALYHATDGPNWTERTNWLSDTQISEWHGVTTDVYGRVTGLFLSGNGLTGEIPPELGSLTDLGGLTLSNNRLSGEIPAALSGLVSLTGLSLSGNQLTGEIPPELGSLTSLTWLSLGGNRLSGEIPSELGNLTALKYLILFENELTGGIPPELGNLLELEALILYGNDLGGGIPQELGNLAELKYLMLSDNRLNGEIPSELRQLTKLEQLQLGENRLTGCVPDLLRDVADNDLDALALPDC